MSQELVVYAPHDESDAEDGEKEGADGLEYFSEDDANRNVYNIGHPDFDYEKLSAKNFRDSCKGRGSSTQVTVTGQPHPNRRKNQSRR